METISETIAMPPQIHASLARKAKEGNISLHDYILIMLAVRADKLDWEQKTEARSK